jgi:hypothetical protein
VDRFIARAGVGSSLVAQQLKVIPNAARGLALVYRTDLNSREYYDAQERPKC